jgi:hypothetical protein
MFKTKFKQTNNTFDSSIYLKAIILISNRLAEVSNEIKLLREQIAVDSTKETNSE